MSDKSIEELRKSALEHMEHAREQVEDNYDHDKLRAFYKSRVRLHAAIYSPAFTHLDK